MINFGKISNVFAKLDGMFKKCGMEPALHGWSVFDENVQCIGMIIENGFVLDAKYKHSDKVAIELNKRGVTTVDYDTFYEVESQMLIDEALKDSE